METIRVAYRRRSQFATRKQAQTIRAKLRMRFTNAEVIVATGASASNPKHRIGVAGWPKKLLHCLKKFPRSNEREKFLILVSDENQSEALGVDRLTRCKSTAESIWDRFSAKSVQFVDCNTGAIVQSKEEFLRLATIAANERERISSKTLSSRKHLCNRAYGRPTFGLDKLSYPQSGFDVVLTIFLLNSLGISAPEIASILNSNSVATPGKSIRQNEKRRKRRNSVEEFKDFTVTRILNKTQYKVAAHTLVTSKVTGAASLSAPLKRILPLRLKLVGQSTRTGFAYERTRAKVSAYHKVWLRASNSVIHANNWEERTCTRFLLPIMRNRTVHRITKLRWLKQH